MGPIAKLIKTQPALYDYEKKSFSWGDEKLAEEISPVLQDVLYRFPQTFIGRDPVVARPSENAVYCLPPNLHDVNPHALLHIYGKLGIRGALNSYQQTGYVEAKYWTLDRYPRKDRYYEVVVNRFSTKMLSLHEFRLSSVNVACHLKPAERKKVLLRGLINSL
jgi:hypothetical protein